MCWLQLSALPYGVSGIHQDLASQGYDSHAFFLEKGEKKKLEEIVWKQKDFPLQYSDLQNTLYQWIHSLSYKSHGPAAGSYS